MVTLQYTLFCTSGKYKPISTLIDVESIDYYKSHSKELRRRALMKMCAQRYVGSSWLKEHDYTKLKVRIYDKEKIEAEKRARNTANSAKYGWKRMANNN